MDEDRPARPPRPPRPPRKVIPAGPAPTEARLREAALAHLARFAATEAGLRRVLQRRVDRWARRAEAEGLDAAAAAAARALAAAVARQLVATGVVDDAAFAEARARR
ncbi:regulatory protein RecX, partial [Paeniroseomonas aquatica]|nr:regulatory protein RecX [Paeniroseomonas aquatica]